MSGTPASMQLTWLIHAASNPEVRARGSNNDDGAILWLLQNLLVIQRLAWKEKRNIKKVAIEKKTKVKEM
jgi:hypothetical protein